MHLLIVKQSPDFYYVGTTKNLENRLEQLQDDNPHEIRLVHTVKLDEAKLYESEFHKQLSDFRVRGNWYRIDDIIPVWKKVLRTNLDDLLHYHERTLHAKQPVKSTGRYMPTKPCKNGHMSERYVSNNICIECYKQYSVKWRRENKERYNQYQRQYNNYTIKHIKTDLLNSEEYLFQNNPNKRRLLLQATPKWADKSTIRNIYSECVEKFEKTQVKMGVDHIVPISHKRVCGLHVTENLQILSNSLKRKKGTFNQERESTSYFLWLKSRGF